MHRYIYIYIYIYILINSVTARFYRFLFTLILLSKALIAWCWAARTKRMISIAPHERKTANLFILDATEFYPVSKYSCFSLIFCSNRMKRDSLLICFPLFVSVSKNAEVTKEWVGLRPGRHQVRIETEVCKSPKGRGVTVLETNLKRNAKNKNYFRSIEIHAIHSFAGSTQLRARRKWRDVMLGLRCERREHCREPDELEVKPVKAYFR